MLRGWPRSRGGAGSGGSGGLHKGTYYRTGWMRNDRAVGRLKRGGERYRHAFSLVGGCGYSSIPLKIAMVFAQIDAEKDFFFWAVLLLLLLLLRARTLSEVGRAPEWGSTNCSSVPLQRHYGLGPCRWEVPGGCSRRKGLASNMQGSEKHVVS